jgi:hypothetical protein
MMRFADTHTSTSGRSRAAHIARSAATVSPASIARADV